MSQKIISVAEIIFCYIIIFVTETPFCYRNFLLLQKLLSVTKTETFSLTGTFFCDYNLFLTKYSWILMKSFREKWEFPLSQIIKIIFLWSPVFGCILRTYVSFSNLSINKISKGIYNLVLSPLILKISPGHKVIISIIWDNGNSHFSRKLFIKIHKYFVKNKLLSKKNVPVTEIFCHRKEFL